LSNPRGINSQIPENAANTYPEKASGALFRKCRICCNTLSAETTLGKLKLRAKRFGRVCRQQYLCCVLAKQGDLATAKKNFELVKDHLITTEENELLAECRQATGEYN
jgi:hypothetical protein